MINQRLRRADHRDLLWGALARSGTPCTKAATTVAIIAVRLIAAFC
ncbi:MAG: hypothetical protein WCF99_11880 [Chloroflexales bacterium]